MANSIKIIIQSVRNAIARVQLQGQWQDKLHAVTGQPVIADNQVTLVLAGHLTDADAISKLTTVTTEKLMAMAKSVADVNERDEVRLVTPEWVTSDTTWSATADKDGRIYRLAKSKSNDEPVTFINYRVYKPTKTASFTL